MIEKDNDLHRYKISLNDFDAAIRFASSLSAHSADTVEHESLLLSAIVAYARPFGMNEKRKSPPITASINVKSFVLSAKELALHELLMEWRNEAVAHSSFKKNPTGFVQRGTVIKSRTFAIVNQQVDIAAVLALAIKIRGLCAKDYADGLAHRNYMQRKTLAE